MSMGAAFCTGSRWVLGAGFGVVLFFLCAIGVGRAQAQAGPEEVMRLKLRRCAKAEGAEQCRAARPVCREPYRREQVQVLLKEVGERDQEYIASLANQGFVMLSQNRYAEAESISRAALALAKAAPGEQVSRDVHILNNLAEALVEEKKHAEAEAVLRQALSASRGVGDDDSRYQDVLEKLLATGPDAPLRIGPARPQR